MIVEKEIIKEVPVEKLIEVQFEKVLFLHRMITSLTPFARWLSKAESDEGDRKRIARRGSCAHWQATAPRPRVSIFTVHSTSLLVLSPFL